MQLMYFSSVPASLRCVSYSSVKKNNWNLIKTLYHHLLTAVELSHPLNDTAADSAGSSLVRRVQTPARAWLLLSTPSVTKQSFPPLRSNTDTDAPAHEGYDGLHASEMFSVALAAKLT